MGAYRYCLECGEQMSKPTTHEAVAQEHPCPSCGLNNSRPDDFTEFLINLAERVERLESLPSVKESKHEVLP